MPEPGQDIESAAAVATVDQLAHQAALRIIDSEEPKEEAKPAEEKPAEEKPSEEKPAKEAKSEEKVETIELDPEAKLFDVEIVKEGGERETQKLSLNELKAQRMMQADYQRKTAELAREREAVQAKIKEAVEPRIKEYETGLQTAAQLIQQVAISELKDINWQELATNDPSRYVALKARADQLNGAIGQIAVEQQRVNQFRQQEMQKEYQKRVTESVQALQDPVKGIPNWNNDLYAKVLETGVKEFGFTREEVNAITDPKAIKVLYEAMKYRELQKAKPEVEKRVEKVPKVVKPGTAEKPDASADEWRQGMARLQKNGGREADAVQLAKLLLQ